MRFTYLPRFLFVCILGATTLAATTSSASQGTAISTPGCHASQPNQVQPPTGMERYANPESTWSENNIWLSIGTDGVLTLGPDRAHSEADLRGWRSDKFIIFRGEGVEGTVEVSGTRTDAPSELSPVDASGPDRQYGNTGFTPMIIAFPSAGCWDLTLTVGDATLTATLDVRFEDAAATPAA